MPKSIYTLIFFFCLTAGFITGYYQAVFSFEQDNTACPSPQHEGEKTIATLVKHEGGLVLRCEKHTVLKSTSSPNKGEAK